LKAECSEGDTASSARARVDGHPSPKFSVCTTFDLGLGHKGLRVGGQSEIVVGYAGGGVSLLAGFYGPTCGTVG
jgi:hypothetical protein